MKKFIILSGLCAGLLSCSKSGSFLDNKTTAIDEAQTFSDSIRTMGFLSRIYVDIGFSFNKGRWASHGNTEAATDDAEYAYSSTTNTVPILYNGTVSPITMNISGGALDFWSTPYANIRRANLLLSKLPITPLSAERQKWVTGEAKFLRAWYYTQLMVVFGGVPMVGDNVYGIDDIINLPRANFADLVTYITTELDAAAPLLPTAWNTSAGGPADAEFGRITRGACLGLKSRVLLYAASALFNGGATTSDANLAKVVSYPTYDASRWQAAADASLAVINSGIYQLWPGVNSTTAGIGFYQTFFTNRTENKEIIFGQYRPANRDFEAYYNPASRSGARNMMPTQNIVDAFPMKNGKAITDPTSGYNANNPYVNRDPRFRYTVIFNGANYATLTGAQAPVYTYNGAPTDGYVPSSSSSLTGYYTRKMCDSTFATGGSGNVDRPWPLMRYAEILLNYAEAINEVGQPELAYEKLKELRIRAGIDVGTDGRYGIKAGMSKDEMRVFIQNERRIELAFEDHRWHDMRRWKIAMAVSNGYNKAMKITATGTAPNFSYTYQVVNTERLHVFRPEMYLLPIPNDDIRKMPAMVQNPGW